MENIRGEGLITFLYYEDLEKASDFYKDIMKFEQVMDKDWVKIYKISGNSHVGLVSGERGWHKPGPEKPVMISVMVPDADAWFKYLKEKGIKTNREAPNESDELKMKGFLLWDPEGYVIEILEFYTPYGL